MPAYLVEFLELDDLCEDILEDGLGIAGVLGQVRGHPQDVATLPHIVLQVIIHT